MSIKVKTTIIILITLAIGFVTGALMNRTLTQRRIRGILWDRQPNRFAAVFERIIKPDDEQAEKIREILKKHGKIISEIRIKFREESEAALEAMRKEIEPILTPEQKKRLQRRTPGPWMDPRNRREFRDKSKRKEKMAPPWKRKIPDKRTSSPPSL